MFLLSSQILHFLVPALGSCTCAIAQSPVSATDQQRHQVSTGQVAQAAAVQDGASWTTTWRLFVHLRMYPSNIFWRENDRNCTGARRTLQNFKVGQKAQPCLASSGVFSAFVNPDETLFFVFQNITSIIFNWGFAFETATVDFRGKRWFPLPNATKITFYSLMKGAFSASRQTGSVSRHYPSTLITFYQLPGRNWTCGTYAPGVTTAMLVYPKKQTSPKGTARVKGREVETVSHITCFINFKPRFDIIVQVVSIAQIVAKYVSRPSRQLYGNHDLQTRGFEADFLFILSIALSLETVTCTFVLFTLSTG